MSHELIVQCFKSSPYLPSRSISCYLVLEFKFDTEPTTPYSY